LLGQLNESFEVVQVRSPLRALSHMTRESFAGLYVTAPHLSDAFQIGKLLQNERILEGMPDGIVVLDSGRVADSGTHEELLALDGLYARLARIQNTTTIEEGFERLAVS